MDSNTDNKIENKKNEIDSKSKSTITRRCRNNTSDIQSLHNQLRLCFYSLISFDKIFREYHKVYKEKVINQLSSSVNWKTFLLDEKKTAFYIICKKDIDFETLSPEELKILIYNNKKIQRRMLYITSQETYYKIKAIKLIVESLLKYDSKLTEYEQYLQHKIQSLIVNQKNFRNLYDYMLNLIHSNGNEYNDEFENLLDEFF